MTGAGVLGTATMAVGARIADVVDVVMLCLVRYR